MRIERLGGPQRAAYLPAEPEPIAFGVHSEVAEHYGVSADRYPRIRRRSTAWSPPRAADRPARSRALEARRIEVDPQTHEAEVVGEIVDGNGEAR